MTSWSGLSTTIFIILLLANTACKSTFLERNVEHAREPGLEGVWEGEEMISEFQLGEKPMPVPTRHIFDIQSVSHGIVQGRMTVHLYLSKVEGLPAGVSDASQTFQVQGKYEYPQVELTVHNEDGSVNGEYRGTISQEGNTLSLMSLSGNLITFIKKEADQNE